MMMSGKTISLLDKLFLAAAFYKSALKKTRKFTNSVQVTSRLESNLEVYVGSYQTYMIELFAKIVNGS